MHHNSQQGSQRQIILLHIAGAYSSIVRLSGRTCSEGFFYVSENYGNRVLTLHKVCDIITLQHIHNIHNTQQEGKAVNEVILRENTTEIQSISSELFKQWAEYIDAAPKTVQTYTRNIKQFAEWLRLNGITAPTRADILRYREELKATHKAATVQGYITAVRLFFKWAALEGLYADISSNIKSVKVDAGHKKDYLTSAQARTVLESVNRDTEQGLRDYAILCLMITTGLRTVSVINADIEDLRTLGDITVLYYQGKGHNEKADFVKIEEPVEIAIRSYLQSRQEKAPGAPLFSSRAHRNGGERMTTRSISRIVKNALIAAGLDSDRLTAHSMRHTFATQALIHGADVQEVQQALGHKSIVTTQIYCHNIEKARNTSSSRVAAVLFD